MHEILENKFETTIAINPYYGKLSQTCLCGNIKKKKLKERVHKCDNCGYEMDRDLLSALLAMFVDPNTHKPDLDKAKAFAIANHDVLVKAWQEWDRQKKSVDTNK